MPNRIIFLVIASLPFLISTAAFAAPSTATQNKVAEVTFTANSVHPDPFNQITLDAVFTDPQGKDRRIPAFWAGGNAWKVRYASGIIGLHRFRTECSDPADAGLHHIAGTVDITPYHGTNPLYLHGPITAAKNARYLQHADGTPFFWLGDTWWMGLTKRLSYPADFQTLAADRIAKGFTVVQIVAGFYPDMPPFDPRGENEAGFPWEKDDARIRPEYFDAADQRIFYLADHGLLPCIVGAWGYHLPMLGQHKMQQHQRYLYARWGALPIVWCVAGELNLPYYGSPDFPNHGEKQTAEWEQTLAYCHSINGFDRLITAHPTGIPPMSMRGVLKNPAVIDFDMLQTPHGQREVLKTTVDTVRFSYHLNPPTPVINAEPSYEMLFDKTPAEIARLMFWACWTNGVKGYTYGANGIWQVNRRNAPYGNSPWGGGYGKISWDDAMNLPGSAQVALGKKLLVQYPWERLEPRPDWAAWADVSPAALLGEWIWFPEGNPAQDAPIAARYFRKTFDLPSDTHIRQAVLHCAADDRCTIWLNGQELGSCDTWRSVHDFPSLAVRLHEGQNVLAIRAENIKSDVIQNPAGLICGLHIELEGHAPVEIKSDATWNAAQSAPADWPNPSKADGWSPARIIARYGDAPWGKIADTIDEYHVPYTLAIDQKMRLIYAPLPRSIRINHLTPTLPAAAFYFDPVTGNRQPLSLPKPAADGSLKVDAPSFGHDWALVIESPD
jgi:hypothetical protein